MGRKKGTKWTIEEVRSFLASENFELISKEFSRVVGKILIRCPKGHEIETSFRSFYIGNRCKYCSRRAKPPVGEVRLLFERCGYTLLDTSYTDNRSRLNYRCPKGHINSMSFSNFKKGHRCPDCYGKIKKDIEFIKAEFKKEGLTLLTHSYKNAAQRLFFECKNGHIHFLSWGNFRSGYRCSLCNDRRSPATYTIPRVKRLVRESGFYYLDFKGSTVSFLCDRGHVSNYDISYFSANRTCGECLPAKKLSIEEVRARFEERGFRLVSKTYEGNDKNVHFYCPRGHLASALPANIMRGQGCGKCIPNLRSNQETELSSYFEKYDPVLNDRSLLSPKELDLFFPKKNVAVEYCGLHWHSDSFLPRDYHYNKMKSCNDKGVRLITVFEDEWVNKPSVVISRIKTALGECDRRVFARKCVVKDISKAESREFLDLYHLQGSSPRSVSFGIFLGEELLGVMTGGSITRKHVAKGKNILELKRMAFLPDLSLIGGASKLFRAFLNYAREKGYQEIRSYQDMRYGNPFNPVYEKLGMSKIGFSKYTPHYVKGKNRYRNYSLRKTEKERESGKTEYELRAEQGYKRIWDCGHVTYSISI